MLTIRSARPTDCDAVYEVASDYQAALGYGCPLFTTPDWWANRIRRGIGSGLFLVVEDASKVVAFLEVFVDVADWYRRQVGILGMCVHQQFRRCGIGRQLVNFATEQSDYMLNLARLELFVWADNEAAISLYESAGFVREGFHKAYGFRMGQHASAVSMSRMGVEGSIASFDVIHPNAASTASNAPTTD